MSSGKKKLLSLFLQILYTYAEGSRVAGSAFRYVSKEWIGDFAGMTEWDKGLVDQDL